MNTVVTFFAKTDRELSLTRFIEAPPVRVFSTWTGRFEDWWGPHGMTTPYCEMDLRPGGVFKTVMRAPDGAEYPTRGVFLEVIPAARIVFTDAFDPGWQPHPDIFFTAVTTFEAQSGSRTKLTARALHWTAESRMRHEEMGFEQGWGESLDRLAALASFE
jgi:uncharacterized protein YndB with AHSA1/START domain